MRRNLTSFLSHKGITAFWYWAPPFLWAGFIYFLSSRPAAAFPQITFLPHADKFVHTFEFAVLGFLLARAMLSQAPTHKHLYFSVIAFCLCVAYGLSDELHQIGVVSRTFELPDLLADALGALGGIILAPRLTHR
jgi:VanZ family protein